MSGLKRYLSPLNRKQWRWLFFCLSTAGAISGVVYVLIVNTYLSHPRRDQKSQTVRRIDAAAFLHAARSAQSDAKIIAPEIELENVDLSDLRLPDTDLSGATLKKVLLDRAILGGSDLSGIDLSDSTAIATHFVSADLADAEVIDTKLVAAQFDGARLSRARFERCDVSDATFSLADVSDMYWSAAPVTPRTLDSLAAAKNLDRLSGPIYALVSLARQFRENGYGRAERAMNAAVRRASDPPAWERLLIDATCGYGAASHRLLLIALGVWTVGVFVYYLSLFSRGRSGVYIVVTRQTKRGMSVRRARLRYGFNIPKAVRTALLFSTLTSFTLPLRGISVREWVMRAQPKQFDMDALGWVRVTAGLQTIAILLLFTLFLIVRFGSPFDIF